MYINFRYPIKLSGNYSFMLEICRTFAAVTIKPTDRYEKKISTLGGSLRHLRHNKSRRTDDQH